MTNRKLTIIPALLTTTLWLLLGSQAVAQQGATDAADAIRLGEFVFHPDITFSQYHDDNIYSTDTAEESDNVSALRAELKLKSDWKQHALGFKLGADANRYASFSSENTVDNWINAEGKYDFSNRASATLAASHINDHEDRASPETLFGLEPTEFTENRVLLSVNRALWNHSLKLAATSVTTDFHDVKTSLGDFNNDYRDRTDDSIGVRFNYALSQQRFVFIQTSFEQRDYDLALDLNLFNRDSELQNYLLGFKFNPRARFNGEIAAGRLSQTFEDARFEDIDETDFSVRLNWQASVFSQLSFTAERELEETTLNNASSLLADHFRLGWRQALDKHWSWYLNASHLVADYQLIPREDDYDDYAIGLNHQLERNLVFGIDLVHSLRDSTEDTDDYRKNTILLRVTAKM